MIRRAIAVGFLLLLAVGMGWSEQKKGQKKPQESAPPPMPMTEEQTINQRISEMLAAWQIGDTNMLHKYYADDVTVVSGLFQPLIAGWKNYLDAYELQRKRVQDVQITRRNTYVNAKGNFAWASYQWEFGGLVDGKPTGARGQTTLVYEKRNGVWLIVHNHTSEICEAQNAAPRPAGSANPGR
jgi:ketosteroid isomerase-like protein